MVTYEIDGKDMIISRIRMFINVNTLLKHLKSKFNCEGKVVEHEDPYHEIRLEGCTDMNAVRKVVEGGEDDAFNAMSFLLGQRGIILE